MSSSLPFEDCCNFLSRTKLDNPVSWWLSSSRTCVEGNLRHVVHTNGEFLFSEPPVLSAQWNLPTCWILRNLLTVEEVEHMWAEENSCSCQLPPSLHRHYCCLRSRCRTGGGGVWGCCKETPLVFLLGKSVHMPLGQGVLDFSWVTKSEDDEAKLPRFKSWLCHLDFQLSLH